jgi:hypothetical protein
MRRVDKGRAIYASNATLSVLLRAASVSDAFKKERCLTVSDGASVSKIHCTIAIEQADARAGHWPPA